MYDEGATDSEIIEISFGSMDDLVRLEENEDSIDADYPEESDEIVELPEDEPIDITVSGDRRREPVSVNPETQTKKAIAKDPQAAARLAALSSTPFSKVPVPTSFGHSQQVTPNTRREPVMTEKERALLHYKRERELEELGSNEEELSDIAVIDSLLEDDDWQDFAECNGVETELFYPERGASTKETKEVCRGCIVREPCLEYALRNGEKFGIWGGMSERERRRIRKQRRALVAVANNVKTDDNSDEDEVA